MGRGHKKLTINNLELLAHLKSSSYEQYTTEIAEELDICYSTLRGCLEYLTYRKYIDKREEADTAESLKRPKRIYYKITSKGVDVMRDQLSRLVPDGWSLEADA